MQIEEIDINKIKPDPDQPRKRFSPETLESLSKNISIEGMINPIEIDEDYVIITGESRWRAAKLAGLKTVPAKIIKMTDSKSRFRRQFLENIHNQTMDIDETAHAIQKFIKMFWKKSTNYSKDQGSAWLARTIGKSHSWVKSHLVYLKLDELGKKIAKKHSPKLIHSLKKMSKEQKLKFLKKIDDDKITNREVKLALAFALVNFPSYEDKIFNFNFYNLKEYEATNLLRKHITGYSPSPITDILKPKIALVEELALEIMSLNTLLKNHSIEELPQFQKDRILSLLYLLHATIEKFAVEKVKLNA